MPQLYALRFDLWCLPPRIDCIIVWPDQPAAIARPVDRDLHWLDVRAGDAIFLKGKRRAARAR